MRSARAGGYHGWSRRSPDLAAGFGGVDVPEGVVGAGLGSGVGPSVRLARGMRGTGAAGGTADLAGGVVDGQLLTVGFLSLQTS